MAAWFTNPAAAAPQTVPDTIGQRVAACAACHGKEGRAGSDGYYPRIAGKPQGYLFNQLKNFSEGRRRQYPLMNYMVAHQRDEYLQEIAEYFAGQHPPYPPPQRIDVAPATLERGRILVTEGDAGKNLPACMSCHGSKLTGVTPSIPGLIGIPRDYINAQFGAWRNGARKTVAPDCMAQITARLSDQDISAVSAWLASQAVPADAIPASATPARLPLECGSVAK